MANDGQGEKRRIFGIKNMTSDGILGKWTRFKRNYGICRDAGMPYDFSFTMSFYSAWNGFIFNDVEYESGE